jgi:hypothetical protein
MDRKEFENMLNNKWRKVDSKPAPPKVESEFPSMPWRYDWISERKEQEIHKAVQDAENFANYGVIN